MILPDPFAYPPVPHASRHAPAGYADYRACKPWLRDDFAFRCAYCLTRERWHPGGHTGFGADHVLPQATHPTLAATYGNLIYACNDCNSTRKDRPLPVSPFNAPLGRHLAVDVSGTITALTEEGRQFIRLFDLASPGHTAVRSQQLALVRLKQTYPNDPDVDALFRRAFGYPDDLPDLAALKPPGGNGHAGSEDGSHFARRQRGELATRY